MNPQRVIIAFLCIALCGHAFAQTTDIDTSLSDLADKLSTQIKDQGKTKVAVIDFTDLDGSANELGKYISEQLTVNLVMDRKGFSVLDRANLQKILAEHKLTATGLVDPDNAKKLGQFAGVDALILGTITPKNQNISLTAKIITTDTAEIVGAARGEFKIDDTVQKLMSVPTATNTPDTSVTDTVSPDNGAAPKRVDLSDDKPVVVKAFGDLGVFVQTLKVVEDGEYLLTMTLTNHSMTKSIWVALNYDSAGEITDSGGFEFPVAIHYITGIQAGELPHAYFGNAVITDNRFNSATEIAAGDSIPVTVKFLSYSRRPAQAGVCNLQLAFLIGHGFDQTSATISTKNLMTKLMAQ